MGSESDGDDFESLATLLALAILASSNATHTLLIVEDEYSRRL